MNQAEFDAEVERLRELHKLGPDKTMSARHWDCTQSREKLMRKWSEAKEELVRLRKEVERLRALVPDPDWLEQIANYECLECGQTMTFETDHALDKLAQRIREANR